MPPPLPPAQHPLTSCASWWVNTSIFKFQVKCPRLPSPPHCAAPSAQAALPGGSAHQGPLLLLLLHLHYGGEHLGVSPPGRRVGPRRRRPPRLRPRRSRPHRREDLQGGHGGRPLTLHPGRVYTGSGFRASGDCAHLPVRWDPTVFPALVLSRGRPSSPLPLVITSAPPASPLQWLRLAHVVYAKPPSPGAGTTTVLFAVDASAVAVPNPLALSAAAAAAGATEEEARAKAALKPAEEALEKAEEVCVWGGCRKCECVCWAPFYIAPLPC